MRTPFLIVLASASLASADPTPLHQKVDALVAKSAGGPDHLAPRSSDAEFLRRTSLDFSGDIPSADAARAFLASTDPDKRTKLIDSLLSGPRYPAHMADKFSVILMERRGENPHWRSYLEAAFAQNKPWNQIVREIVRADHRDEPARGAAFFYSKRLEKYGENPTDFPGLTRDVGRLFLGLDLQCAECHNDRSIDFYKQADFQGLHAAFLNLKLLSSDPPAIEENVMEAPVEFASVFNHKKKTTAPRIPGLQEIAVQTFEKADAYLVPPDKATKSPGIPRYSPLSHFADSMPDSPTFAPNIANRLWFLLLGHGIVEPLDLHHPDNPPSHPELLDLLASSLRTSGYDIRYFLREIALTETYQRSGQLPDNPTPPPPFAAAVERRLSAEQLFQMVLTATANSPASLGEEKSQSLRKKFLDAFSTDPKEPELHFEASLKGALLFLNDPEFAALVSPSADNLAARITGATDDAQAADDLFLHIFSRLPTDPERDTVSAFLKENAARRADAAADLIWAMLASAEFATNH